MSFIETFGIKDATVDALSKGVEAYTKDATKTLVTDHLIGILCSEVAPAFLGSVATTCLKLIAGMHNDVSRKLDKLLREPFQTGMTVASGALALRATNADEKQFRSARLRTAIDRLDIALSHADSDEDQKLLIHLVQGLCSKEVSGGIQFARSRLSVVADALEKSIPPFVRSELESEWAAKKQLANEQAQQAKDWLWGVSIRTAPKPAPKPPKPNDLVLRGLDVEFFKTSRPTFNFIKFLRAI